MSSNPNQSFTKSRLPLAMIVAAICTVVGCQDGPLYALKVANPYYSLGEWKRDEAIGVTDHQRRQQLAALADTIGQMSEEKQQFWTEHLQKIIANDDSPEMRRLAVRAAGRLKGPVSVAMIDKGLDDDSIKVRMEACEALGRRLDENSARLLVATVGTEISDDVKHAALTALANHKNPIAIDSLKLALSDRNPATRQLAVESLKDATGKNFGNDPAVWIANLNAQPQAGENESGQRF